MEVPHPDEGNSEITAEDYAIAIADLLTQASTRQRVGATC